VCIKKRSYWCSIGGRWSLFFIQITHGVAGQCQRVGVVLGQVVGHARQARVHITAAQVFGAHHLTRGGLHQGGATQKDGALVFDDDGFIAHGRHIGTAGRAAAHHHGNLRNALRTHIGLVEEDAAKVLAVGEHIVLVGQVGTAGIHQINTGQVVLLGNFLCTQMLFDRYGVVGTAFDGGIVAHHHAVHATDPPNARNQACARCIVVVHVQRRQRGQLQKRRAGVQQQLHALTRQQLAARHMLGAGRFATTLGNLRAACTQVIDQGLHGRRIGLEVR